MKTLITLILILVILLGCKNTQKASESNSQAIKPNPVADTYFDTTITDPFRHLEKLEDSCVEGWFREQGQRADEVLSAIPGREELIELMRTYDQRKMYHMGQIHVTENGKYFYLKRKSDEEIFKLYYRESFDSEEVLMVDPEDLKMDNNPVIIFDFSPDWKGDKVAVAIASNGSDIMDIVIYDVKKGGLLPQTIKGCFNASDKIAYWMPDNQGFLYLQYAGDNPSGEQSILNTKTRYYKLGEDASLAVDVFSRASCPDLDIKAEDFPIVSIGSQSDKYIIGIIAGPTIYNDAYYIRVEDLAKGKLNWKSLYKKEHKIMSGACVGDDFVFISANNASNRMLCRTKLDKPDFEHPELLVTEKADEVIQDFRVTSSGLYYTTTKNGVEAKLCFHGNGKDHQVTLPNKYGRIFIENKSHSKPDLWVTVAGWTTDMQRMKYNIASNEFTPEDLVPKAAFPEFEGFKVEELTVESHDGTLVPLSVISKKEMKRDGSNPTLLYGYGAYGIPWRPYFLPDWLTWVENGGVLCFSHIRGGGEKGDQWHLDGKSHNKPNSWKDFIACSEYLIDNNYTSNKKLVIYGGSAGGIVIGRSMTERPDLYAAVISEVGMVNAVRFSAMPSGLNHAKEFGYIDIMEDCKDLIEMDAYLHLQDNVSYPPFLGIVGMNDLRVSPWQTGKFVAKLQQNKMSDNPVIMMVDFDEGHYFNSTKTKSMEKLAGVFSFAFRYTGCDGFQ